MLFIIGTLPCLEEQNILEENLKYFSFYIYWKNGKRNWNHPQSDLKCN